VVGGKCVEPRITVKFTMVEKKLRILLDKTNYYRFFKLSGFLMTLVRSRLEIKMEPVIQMRNVKQKEGQTWELVHPDSESVVHSLWDVVKHPQKIVPTSKHQV